MRGGVRDDLDAVHGAAPYDALVVGHEPPYVLVKASPLHRLHVCAVYPDGKAGRVADVGYVRG